MPENNKQTVTSNLLEVPSPNHGGVKRGASDGMDATAQIGMSRVSMRAGVPLQPDGGWGWMVCVTSMAVNGIVFGTINCFGILFVALREKYSKDDPNVSFKTSWVGSVNIGVTFFMCMLAGIVSDRIGIRTTGLIGGVLAVIGILSSAFVEDLMLLYLTYGCIAGFGFSLVYAPSLVILGHYFRRHMGIVNGIVTFGSSLVTVALTFLMPAMLSTLSLRQYFFVHSGLVGLLVLCPLTWKPVLPKAGGGASGAQAALSTMSMEILQSQCADCLRFTRRFLNIRIWSNRGYVVWALSIGFSLFGYFVPFIHLPQYVKNNFPSENGHILVMCLAISSGVARIVVGKVADFKWVNRIRLQQLAFFLLGAATVCIPWSPKFGGLIALCLIMGVCDGAFICLLGPIAFDIVGEKGASQALGFLFGIFSIPMLAGPPIAGFLYDHMNSYNVAFHLAGVPPIIGAALMFLIPKTKPNVPAVLTIQEMGAISCHDILTSRMAIEETIPEPAPMPSIKPASSSEVVTIQDVSELCLINDGSEQTNGHVVEGTNHETQEDKIPNGSAGSRERTLTISFDDKVHASEDNTSDNKRAGEDEVAGGGNIESEEDEKTSFIPADDGENIGQVDV